MVLEVVVVLFSGGVSIACIDGSDGLWAVMIC
jgi:hypothetical protein